MSFFIPSHHVDSIRSKSRAIFAIYDHMIGGIFLTEKHRYSLELWKLLIQDQKNSGMKIEDWCKANGYTKDAYYYWLKQLRIETLPATLDQLQTSVVPQQSFVDVTPVPQTPDSNESEPFRGMPSAVIRKNGMEICLFNTASAEFIRHLMESMKNA